VRGGDARVMPLAALISQIDDISADLAIYVADTGLSPATPAMVQPEPADGAAPRGMRYLLEVELARQAIVTWSGWRAGRVPGSDDKAEAVVYYAEHDAFMPVE
jgi:hypothetical protein